MLWVRHTCHAFWHPLHRCRVAGGPCQTLLVAFPHPASRVLPAIPHPLISLQPDQRASWCGSGPATGTRLRRSLVSRVTQSPAHAACSDTRGAKLHRAVGTCVSLVQFGLYPLSMSVSSDPQGAAAAVSALLSLAAPAFYSLHGPPVPLQRGAHVKCHPLAPKASGLLAGGWEQDQHDGCLGRIVPRQPNFSPSAQGQLWESSKAGAGAAAGWGARGAVAGGPLAQRCAWGAPEHSIPHAQGQTLGAEHNPVLPPPAGSSAPIVLIRAD